MDGTYPEIVEALSVDGPDVVADGEVVAFKDGQTSFERLQGRLGIHDPERARKTGIAVFLYLFDVLSDAVAVHRPVGERLEDQQVERAAEDVRAGRFGVSHRVSMGA